MARRIQTQTGPSKGGPSITGLVARAMFWIALAVVLHISLIPKLPRDVIGYAYWAPHAFTVLGLLNIARAVRRLLEEARNRRRPLQILQNAASRQVPIAAKSANGGGLSVNRVPTVQRRH